MTPALAVRMLSAVASTGMSKKTHETADTTSSRSTMIGMAVAVIAVVALVVWALTRTVEPTTASAPPPALTDTPTTTVASTTAPVTFTGDTPPAQNQETKSEVVRISVEDFRPKFDAGSVVVIDVRDSAAYASGHIPGAMNIPFASIQGFTDMIPKGKEIVTYCT